MAIQRELWQNTIVEGLFADNSFMSKAVNDDMYVNQGKKVHIPNAGAPSGVQVNRTKVPATAAKRTDVDVEYTLDELTTDPIYIPHAETVELSYSKRNSVISQDRAALIEAAAEQLLYDWAPASTSFVRTSGAATAAYTASATGNRKALVKDSLSAAARYNLASALYRQENFDGAREIMGSFDGQEVSADVHYNTGDIALQLKDYAAAVEAFRQSLLKNPGDLDAKENYVYAKKMLENQQNQQQGGGQDQQDDRDDQKNDQEPSGQQPQNRPDDGQDDSSGGDNEPAISPQQAQQMLNAVQAREQQTRDKVDREKAAVLKSRQKEKNW